MELTIQLKDNSGNQLFPRTKWKNIIDRPTVLSDISINGTSVVENDKVNLSTSNGITVVNKEFKLTLSEAEQIYPKEMSLEDQAKQSIFLADENDVVKKTSLNDLDYTKMRVTDSDSGFSTINNKDFLFVKENY